MKKCKLGIVGATGLVGQKILKILREEGLINKFDIYLITSEKSAGKRLFAGDCEYKLYKLDESCLSFGLDYVFFSAGDEISKQWAERFVSTGAYVIDNTNAFRHSKDVPLVVPEINGCLINKNTKIISNPNCSTIQLVVALDCLKKLSKILKVYVSTYQSVSGAGKRALLELSNNERVIFEKGIKNNIIPQIGNVDVNGFCTEENKIMFETNKILDDDIRVFATTVRVPICFCHGESVFVEFDKAVKKEDIILAINKTSIKFSENDVFYPTECEDTNETYICRMKRFSDTEYGFFVLADNLRRGAAYNAVGILKIILKKNELFYIT